MPATHPHRLRAERGQASVELLGVLPFALLAALVCWQLALTGHTAWLAANAARVAARAEAVGRDGPAAARTALPKSLERGLKVSDEQNGAVTVKVHVPVLLTAWRSPLTIAASASLAQEP